MKIEFDTAIQMPQSREEMVGNVYPIRGGFGARNGHMQVVVSYYDKVRGCCRYSGFATLTIDTEGDIVGASAYGAHYFDNKIPIGRVEGLDELALVMRSI